MWNLFSEQMIEARPNAMVLCSVTFQPAKKNKKMSTPKGFCSIVKT